MKKKNTDGLQQELMDSPDLTQFLSQNQEQFVNKNVAELLNHLFEKKNISKSGSRQTVRHERNLSAPDFLPVAEILPETVCCVCVTVWMQA